MKLDCSAIMRGIQPGAGGCALTARATRASTRAVNVGFSASRWRSAHQMEVRCLRSRALMRSRDAGISARRGSSRNAPSSDRLSRPARDRQQMRLAGLSTMSAAMPSFGRVDLPVVRVDALEVAAHVGVVVDHEDALVAHRQMRRLARSVFARAVFGLAARRPAPPRPPAEVEERRSGPRAPSFGGTPTLGRQVLSPMHAQYSGCPLSRCAGHADSRCSFTSSCTRESPMPDFCRACVWSSGS